MQIRMGSVIRLACPSSDADRGLLWRLPVRVASSRPTGLPSYFVHANSPWTRELMRNRQIMPGYTTDDGRHR